MKRATQHNSQPSLLRTLIYLTLLLIIAQWIFFFIHYHVSELIDAFVSSSLVADFYHASIILPLVAFFLIQLMAYALGVGWIWFISMAASQCIGFSSRLTYMAGVLMWCVAIVALFSLNQYYFPHSFFATGLSPTFLSQTTLVVSLLIMGLITFIAYAHTLITRHFLRSALFYLGLIGSVSVLAWYEHSLVFYSPLLVQDKRPNIILIGLDSLRPDFTHYYGHASIHTPHIDDFLKTAVTFNHAYTPLARTYPAWMSILTATYPKQHHARNNLVDATSIVQQDNMAKHFQQAGYETLYATDENRFSNLTTAYGFDRVIGPKMGVPDFLLGGLSDFPVTNVLVNSPLGRFLFPYQYGNRAAHITYQPQDFLHLLQRGLAKRQAKPLFLAVHLCVSHWPFTFAGDQEEEDWRLPRRYQRSVEAVDKQLGQVLQQLADQGLLHNAWVIVLSDHGTSLGLPGDKIIAPENYHGDPSQRHLVPVARFSHAPTYSMDFKHDYSMHTVYGQGTDVLSVTQHHVLLAFKRFGVSFVPKQSKVVSSLLDIAPTLLDLLALPPLPQAQGISLRPYLFSSSPPPSRPRPLFFETGDSLSEIETDHIAVEKVVQHKIGIYRIHTLTAMLSITPSAERSILNNKQRAVLLGDWLLARYPAHWQTQWSAAQPSPTRSLLPAYFVIVHIPTQQWTIGLTSPFAKTAPLVDLLREFNQFYGDEI